MTKVPFLDAIVAASTIPIQDLQSPKKKKNTRFTKTKRYTKYNA